MTETHGTCDPAFNPVREAFAGTFAAEGPYQNAGASLCVYVRDRCVVDLHAGEATPHQAWTADTLVNIWSATKGVVATAVAMLVDKGLLSFDAPVTKYWPEFAQGGKQETTVAQLMSHQAGVNGYVVPTTLEDLCDWEVATSRLAAQEPFWTPGEQTSYHAVTYGFLAGELVRRASGKSVGRFLADEIRAPLQAGHLHRRSRNRATAHLARPWTQSAAHPVAGHESDCAARGLEPCSHCRVAE